MNYKIRENRQYIQPLKVTQFMRARKQEHLFDVTLGLYVKCYQNLIFVFITLPYTNYLTL